MYSGQGGYVKPAIVPFLVSGFLMEVETFLIPGYLG